MGCILVTDSGFHWKGYASVDVTTGQPLGSLIHSRKPLRRQQSRLLARKDAQHPSANHWRVKELAANFEKQVEAWEQKTESPESEAQPNQDITVTEFYQTIFLPWLESQVATAQKSHSTFVTYKRYWDTYLADHFNGTKTFKNYRPYLGVQFLQDLRQENGELYGEATITHIHSTARSIFARAVELDYAVSNPWRDIKVGNITFVSAEQGPAFTEKEVEKIITNLDADRDGRSDWNVQMAQCVLAVGIWAGLRPSETAALQWQSINMDAATINVRSAFVYGKESPTTKTGKDRIVPFRDNLTPVLKAWWETNGKPESGWVFPNRDNNPVNVNTLSERIIQPNCIAHKMNWEGYAFYGLRRGFGTLLVHDGWSAEEVSKAMGNSIDVVMKYYFVDKENKLATAARERSRAKGGK